MNYFISQKEKQTKNTIWNKTQKPTSVSLHLWHPMKAQGMFWAIVHWIFPLEQHFHHPSPHILFSTTPAPHYLWQTQLFDRKHFLYLFQYSLRILLNTDNHQFALALDSKLISPPLTLRCGYCTSLRKEICQGWGLTAGRSLAMGTSKPHRIVFAQQVRRGSYPLVAVLEEITYLTGCPFSD